MESLSIEMVQAGVESFPLLNETMNLDLHALADLNSIRAKAQTDPQFQKLV